MWPGRIETNLFLSQIMVVYEEMLYVAVASTKPHAVVALAAPDAQVWEKIRIKVTTFERGKRVRPISICGTEGHLWGLRYIEA